jgi:anti-anti-sigma factor
MGRKMNLDEYRVGRVIVFVLDGHIDKTAAVSIGERIETALQPCTDGIVLDLESVSGMDAVGVPTLLNAAARARLMQVDLHLCSLSFKLRQAVVQSGLPDRFPVHARRADAVSAATKRS